jgi:rare lipoprotein A
MKKVLWILILLVSASKISAQVDSSTKIFLKDTVIHIEDTLQTEKKVVDSSNEYVVKSGVKSKLGIASFYSKNLDGTKTATGERFKNSNLTAASNSFKLNTWVKVTNIHNGNWVIVRINDRMHPRMAKRGRVIDLSRSAAIKLDFIKKGLTKVRIEVVEKRNVD